MSIVINRNFLIHNALIYRRKHFIFAVSVNNTHSGGHKKDARIKTPSMFPDFLSSQHDNTGTVLAL